MRLKCTPTLLATALSLTSLLLLLLPEPANAQNEARHWYFGRNVATQFQAGNIVKETFASSMFSGEGCATYSYPNTGSLMLYTDGIRIWGADNEIMPGSDYRLAQNSNPQNLTGSSTQPALVVPNPDNPDIVYVFNTGNHSHLTGRQEMQVEDPYLDLVLYNQYSVVDLSLRSGMGDLVERVQLEPRIEMSERLTGIADCLEEGYWVVTRSLNDNSYYSYRVTGEGVDPEPVVTRIGFSPVADSARGIGQMKISPDGSMLAVALYGENEYAFELFDFNRVTGELSNPRLIRAPIWDFINDFVLELYGLTFSPECKYIYMASRKGPVLQFSLEDKSEAAIQNSLEFMPNNGMLNDLGTMQIAPDGNIYIAQRESFMLSRITNPDNSPVLEVDAVEVGARIGVQRTLSTQGLPNFMDHIFNKTDKENSDCDLVFADFTLSAEEICEGDCIDIVNTTRGSGSAYIWDFGDADPATSTQKDPGQVCFPRAGQYEISLTVEHPLVGDVARKTIRVLRRTNIEIEGPQERTVCRGESLELTVSADAGTIIWEPAEGLDATDPSAAIAQPLQTTTYRVRLEAADACEVVEAQVTIRVVDVPELQVDAIEPICDGEQIRLRASGAQRYSWSPAELFDDPTSATPLMTARFGSDYSVRGFAGGDGDCEAEVELNVEVLQNLSARVEDGGIICRGESMQLNASGGVRYEWSPRTGLDDFTSPSPVASPQADTRYTVTIFDENDCALELPVDLVVRDSVEVLIALPAERLTEPGQTDSIPVVITVAERHLPLRGVNVTFVIEIDKTYLRVEGVSNGLSFTNEIGPVTQRVTVTFEGDIESTQTVLTHLIGSAMLTSDPLTDITLDNLDFQLANGDCVDVKIQNGQFGIHEYCLGYTVVWRTLLALRVHGNPVTGTSVVGELDMPNADDVTLELRDVVGTSILTNTIPNQGVKTVELELDVTAVPAGVYYLTAKSTWQSSTQAIVISR